MSFLSARARRLREHHTQSSYSRNTIPAIHQPSSLFLRHVENGGALCFVVTDQEFKKKSSRVENWGTESRAISCRVSSVLWRVIWSRARKHTAAVLSEPECHTSLGSLCSLECAVEINKWQGLRLHPSARRIPADGNHRLPSKPRLWIQIMFYLTWLLSYGKPTVSFFFRHSCRGLLLPCDDPSRDRTLYTHVRIQGAP